jgi:predicted RNA binding protein YcfA (HicA-like mRNA interferase family)
MDYLTKDSAGSHVMLTDTDGNIITVSKHEIKKIVPTYLSEDINLTEIEI